MRYRSILAAAILIATALAAPAAPAPAVKSGVGPPVVFQFATGQKLLESVKKIVGIVAGEGFAGVVDGQIKAKLGEKGFAGVDMTKPACGYLYLPNKALKGPEDFKEIYGFVAIPVTGENEFKDFLLLIEPNDPLNFKPVDGNKGLYSLETNKGESDVPVRARFHDGHVYIGINAKDELLDAKALLAVKSLVKADDAGLFLARIFTDRYSEELLKQQAAPFEELNDKIQMLGGFSELAASILKSYTALSQRMSSQMKDTEESGFRLVFDEKSAEIAIESYAKPKQGSAYARELAAMKPGTNRFASLFADNLAAGGLWQLPIAAPEIRDIFGKIIVAGQKGKDEAPEFERPVLDELLKGLGRTIKGESIDFALGVNGPNKDGKFTAFGAVNFDDATGLEKALREAIKNDDFKEQIGADMKFDVEKIEGVSIHRRIAKGEGDQIIKSVFGSMDSHFAFGPKGIYFAMGPDWKDSMKAALAPKAGPAKVFDLVANPKRLGDLIKAGNETAGMTAATLLGSEDRRVNVLSISYEGGETLKARMSISLKVIPKVMVGWFTLRAGG